MNYLDNSKKLARSTGYYYPLRKSTALEFARAVLGAILLLMLAPLLFSLAGGSFGLFGVILAVEFIGVFLGVFKFIKPPKGLPPLIPANCAQPLNGQLDDKDDLKQAA